MRAQDIFPLSFRIPDWRQQSDIVIVAPKVRHLNKNSQGYSCPSGSKWQEAEGLGLDLDFKIQYNGYLAVYIYVNIRSQFELYKNIVLRAKMKVLDLKVSGREKISV